MSGTYVTRFSGVIAPTVEVNGQTVLAMSKGFGAFQSMAEGIMAEEGLSQIDPNRWYSARNWLSAFERIRAKVGPRTLHQIGLKIPESAKFPPEINNIHAALASIDAAYHMNHRGGDIGVYGYKQIGEKAGDILANNPYPCPFDEGIITAMARRFERTAKVTHDPSSCRDRKDAYCLYHVTW